MNNTPVFHDLVLLGGGHSHLTVIKKFGMHPVHGLRVTLINKDVSSQYSGMLPGLISGKYLENEVQINLAYLCQYYKIRFVIAEATGLDITEKKVFLKNRTPIFYDTISINTGGENNLELIPGAKQFSIPAKPISNFIHLIDKIRSKIHSNDKLKIRVIGGGAGSVEIALSINQLMLNHYPQKKYGISIISKNKKLLKQHSRSTQKNIFKHLKKEKIEYYLGYEVKKILFDKIETDQKLAIKSDLTFLVTDISAPKWLKQTKLKLSNYGFIEINPFLQSINNENVFASGDVSNREDIFIPKAGVFAVRQGKVLANNIRNYILNKRLKKYRPQRYYLSLIGNGYDFAIASWGNLSFSGKVFWKLKDFIDRKFVNNFNDLPKMKIVKILPNPKLIRSDDYKDPSLSEISCKGCGSKTQWTALNDAFNKIDSESKDTHLNILNSINIRNDAAVIDIPPDMQIVKSVDLLSAMISDPYDHTRIAAIHSISDLIASSAMPKFAEAIFILPSGNKLSQERLLFDLLGGCRDVFSKHEMTLIGGHTSEGSELQIGFAVTGFRNKKIKFANPNTNHSLILTKPLGVGVILAGHMRGKTKYTVYKTALDLMLKSNIKAGEVFMKNNINLITDVTGFGLARHALNLVCPLGLKLYVNKIPILDGVMELFEQNIFSSLSGANLVSAGFKGEISAQNAILFDPQTSGGILACVENHKVNEITNQLFNRGVESFLIGEVTSKPGLQLIK